MESVVALSYEIRPRVRTAEEEEVPVLAPSEIHAPSRSQRTQTQSKWTRHGGALGFREFPPELGVEIIRIDGQFV